MKFRLMTAVLMTFITFAAYAGDLSDFVNLGFSSDSKTFMFGVHGIDSANSQPWARIYLVDVPGNSFRPGGELTFQGTKPVALGQDSLGAFLTLFRNAEPQMKTYGVNNESIGRIIYVYLNGEEQKPELKFRDFASGASYDLTLSQTSRTPIGSAIGAKNGRPDSEAAFSIAVTFKANENTTKILTVGKADYFRPHVSTYRIRQVILSPDETSLIIVVEKLLRDGNGYSSDFMVETLSLR